MNKSKANQILINMLCNIKNHDEMRFFLEQILTTGEINDLLDRIRIYHLLACTDSPQRECAKTLNVSISKVTRGSANLQKPKSREYWKSKFDSLN
ncbi:trp operon repressor [Polynucleobacter sp. Latsch14-2]|jgi:Trp operon repressor|uniref:trp operon repressor n=1 Tax=Polynucleobacter sp. Latsch14-2 TaxID=2576920 RepID=UPI001C0D6EE9|nr:trp operon repressor [Polynucleobacter sp. Latsch14-2]